MTATVSRRHLLNAAGLLLLVLLILPIVAYAVPSAIGAQQSYVVMSGSMEPAIETGSVIFVYDRDPSAIEEGDVITYNLDGQRTEVTTHRVVDVVSQEGQRAFVTKGDANEDPDPYRVPSDAVIGVVPMERTIPVRVPYLGQLLLFAQSKRGIVLFVFVPAGLLVVTEVWDLYKAATSGGETDSDDDEQVTSAGESD